ncbi:MAG: carbohydrate kinase, partial [Kiritimatiellaeota bacterium]|nr:carbohydrate kinase [Kiritimatiellota bacterium]
MACYLLGIDNGGTLSKAALFDLAGREIAVSSRKAVMYTPKPGHYERDSDGMWADTAASIREVLEKSGVNPADIAAVACTGFGNGLFLTDKQGKPVRRAISSMDSRARSYVEKWQAHGEDAQARPKTMQSLWAGQPNALLAWLKDHEPEIMKKAGWVLLCKDYIRFKLTGEIQAELTDMSATSLMDLRTCTYDQELFDLWGISEMIGLMPPIVQTAEVCGRITKQAAAETRLKAGTPVAGGLFDVDACGLASGLVDENQLGMVAGTWGHNQFVSTVP